MDPEFSRTLTIVLAVGVLGFLIAAGFLVIFWFALRSEEGKRKRWIGTVPRLIALIVSMLVVSGVLFWIAARLT